MPIIEKCSEYNVRVIKKPDFKNKSHGYNFAYPVMNTVDICDLFISGGEKEISMNGKSKSIFAFDMENKTLTITERGSINTYIIEDMQELGEMMIKYFDEHQVEIFEKTRETNQKKSQAKIGNQYAKKDESIKETPKLETNEDILREYPIDYHNYKKKLEETVANNPQDFCQLDEYYQKYGKSAGEYFYWLAANAWLWKMNSASSNDLKKIGYDIDKAKEVEKNIILRNS
ncbi:MAG: hypothetical protein SO206_06210 [Bacilli bacterium]|nr:hypothetical protein [Bacilli bacterium]